MSLKELKAKKPKSPAAAELIRGALDVAFDCDLEYIEITYKIAGGRPVSVSFASATVMR